LVIPLSLILFPFSHARPAIQKQQKVAEIPRVKPASAKICYAAWILDGITEKT
jgi:hypothetical protein